MLLDAEKRTCTDRCRIGIDERLDEDFWFGVEMLMRDNRRDLQRLSGAEDAEQE